MKVVNWEVADTLAPVGDFIYTRQQVLRIYFTDFCGNTRYYPLGTLKLASEKIDENYWKLVQD